MPKPVCGDRSDLLQKIRLRAGALLPELRSLRQELHERPELGLHLPYTTKLVSSTLLRHGIEPDYGEQVTSILARIGGDRTGQTVVLRADMDALPILEAASNRPRSQQDGRMHACGHDLHAAMAAGAAVLLDEHRDQIEGQVVIIWQPGEEGHNGMRSMLDDGLMEYIGSDGIACYALHVLSDTLPWGVFAGRPGPSHASVVNFGAVFRGAGGHAGFPHNARDPFPAVATFISQVQVAIARTFDVFDPVIVSIGNVSGGGAHNAIPEQLRVEGTARAFTKEGAARLPDVIRRVAEGCALAHDVSVQVDYDDGYPIVENARVEVDAFRDVVSDLFGEERFQALDRPIGAADDMSRLMGLLPGAFFLLGAGVADGQGQTHPNHSPQAQFDDRLLADGAAALAAVAIRRLWSAKDSEKVNDDEA